MDPHAALLAEDMAIVVAVGILAQLIAERVRMPSIVFLLAFGVLVGPDVLGWVDPREMGDGLTTIVSLAVALILFEGGLQLHLVDLAEVGRSLRNLITVGAAITVAGAALVAHHVVGLAWPAAVLFGAIVVVTGPTVINPLLDRVRVRRRVDTILRGEGILIDPIGAILTVIVLEVILTAEASWWVGLSHFLERIVVGGGIGLLAGWTLGRMLRIRRLVSDDLKNLLVLGWVLALFAASQAIAAESGILAVVVAGMAVRRESIPQERLLRRFKSQLSVLFISILFILLSANLPLETLRLVGWSGVAGVLLLMWIVRPVSVLVSTWQADLDWRERLFLMWICPRGVVAISIASFIALLMGGGSREMTATGLDADAGQAVLALVFLTIAITVVVQGLTAGLVAGWLGIRADDTRRAIVVGANPLGRLLARTLQDHEREPVVIDSNPFHSQRASNDGLVAIVGNALDREILERAGIEGASELVAVTPNQEINFLVAQIAKEDYHVAQVYPVLVDRESGAHEELVERMGGDVAFGREVDVVRWSLEISKGHVELVERTVPKGAAAEPISQQPYPEEILPLAVVRNGLAEPCHGGQVWGSGDRVLFAVRGDPARAAGTLDVLLRIVSPTGSRG